ncbi:hypothetical protein [uncultured Sphingomonas sp.]|uniref:hypothetical protein n=1 Tax=uncultured Sphingomonas sp. TaxID=158754 RepID=UPI0025E06D5B|nr:hypothetical protein [uncultured Sphingomonas sp.]
MFDKTFKSLTRVRGEGIIFSVRPDPSIDLTGRVYNFTIWTAIGKVTTNVESKDGELSKDESGNPVFLWNFKGELTERLYLIEATINWSLNDRLNDKIEYIRGGTITIIPGPSTLTMDNDAGAEARYIDRITIKENPEDQDNPANYTVVTLPCTATPAPVPAPVNSVAPAISGTAQVGSVLTVSNGSWSGSPTSFAYVWNVGGTTVSGATSAAYTPVSGDVGKTVTATVTAVNAGGSTSATSAATSAVSPMIIAAPSAFAWDFTNHPLTVNKQSNSKFSASLDPKSKVNASIWSSTVEYWVVAGKDNSGNGLSEATAVGSIAAAIKKLNDNTSATAGRIRIKSGEYGIFHRRQRRRKFAWRWACLSHEANRLHRLRVNQANHGTVAEGSGVHADRKRGGRLHRSSLQRRSCARLQHHRCEWRFH